MEVKRPPSSAHATEAARGATVSDRPSITGTRHGFSPAVTFREVARHVDDLCLIRSMRHDSPIHTPADYLTLTGSLTGQRPSLGAWFAYGLGSENRDLPAFISMTTGELQRPGTLG
jgi:hypothetical protein